MNKAGADSEKMIFSPRVRSKFGAAAQEVYFEKNLHISQSLLRDQIQLGKDTTLEAVDQYMNESIKNPSNRDYLIGKARETAQGAVDAGYINPHEIKKYLDAHEEKAGVETVKLGMETNLQGTIEELKKGEKGSFGYMDASKRVPLLREAESKQHNDKIITKGVTEVMRQATTHSLMTMAMTHTLKSETLEESFLNQTISDSTFKSLQDKIDGVIGPDKSNSQSYSDLVNLLLDDKTKVSDAQDALLKANKDKKISDKDMTKLYNFHIRPSEEGFKSLHDQVLSEKLPKTQENLKVLDSRKEADKQFEKNKEALGAVKQQIGDYTQDTNKQAKLFSDTLDYAEQNNMELDKIHQAAQQIIIDNTKKTLQGKLKINTVPKGGMNIVDPTTGAERWLNEDWTITPTPSTNNNG
jgi:small nuclear ribonucleoprotein (snRNP)-like protein